MRLTLLLLATLLLLLPPHARGQPPPAPVAVAVTNSVLNKLLAYNMQAIGTTLSAISIPGYQMYFGEGDGIAVGYSSFALSGLTIGAWSVVPLSNQQLQVSMGGIAFSVSAPSSITCDLCLPCGGAIQAQPSGLSITIVVNIGLDGDVFQVSGAQVSSMFQQSLGLSYNADGVCLLAGLMDFTLPTLHSAVIAAVQTAFVSPNSVGGAIQNTVNAYLGQMHGMCGIQATGNGLTLYRSTPAQGCASGWAPSIGIFAGLTVLEYSVVLDVGPTLNRNGSYFGCIANPQCCTGAQCLGVTGAYVALTQCSYCPAFVGGAWFLGTSSAVAFVPQ
jgi:hypothetical protein